MKQCPTCRTNYADDTLRFCLEDGTPLVDSGEQETVVRPADRGSYITEQLPSNVTTPGGDATRVEVPTGDRSTRPITIQKVGSDFPWTKFVVVALAVGLIAVVAAGLLGVAFYVGSGRKDNVVISSSPTPRPTQTPDDEKKRLEDEVAKLRKKLEDSNSSSDDAFDFSDLAGLGGSAEVNSPKDGFLALRNLPNVQYGERIAKIPHGAAINILMCSDDTVTIDTRTGHWCMVSYSEQVGWVFDAWLVKKTKS